MESKSKIYIKNISSVYQYKLTKPNKLLTIFGEYHNQKIDCGEGKKSISLAEFIIDTLKYNKNTKVILEYNAGIDYKTILSVINSDNIREIIKALDDNKLIDKILPVDCRDFYLGVLYHRELYNNPKMNKSFSYINTHYINKFLLAKISINPNVQKNLVCILKDYLQEVKDLFLYLKDNWDKIPQPINYAETIPFNLYLLRDAWSKVVDYYILEQLFMTDDTTEYICLIGDKHRENLQKFISKAFKISTKHQVARDNDCICVNKMIHGTYVMQIIASEFAEMKF
jgi:hypothetical protein